MNGGRRSFLNPWKKGGFMAPAVLLDEFHLSVFVPRGLPAVEAEAVRRTLDGRPFRAAMGRALRRVFRREPAPRQARVTLGR
jgi:hypothetical protein